MNQLPESLHRLVDETGPHPEIVYRRRHRQGRLTASVHGCQVRITVSLRGWWARLMDAQISDEQFRRTCSIAEFWLRLAIVGTILFLACEIIPAFFSGGPVDRIVGGGR